MAKRKSIQGYKNLLKLTNKEVEISGSPDDRSGASYLPDPELVLATEVALVTGRPLLIYGVPGSGKSSWAPYVARNLNWAYHEINVTGDLQANDMFYHFDALKRLRDAQSQVENIADENYVSPRAFWYAFDFQSATDFVDQQNKEVADLPAVKQNARRDVSRSVMLVDEIDKADPNLPNALLDVIACRQIPIHPLGYSIAAQVPSDAAEGKTIKGKPKKINRKVQPINKHANLLIVFTTNEERDLPPAFSRRCIVHRIKDPNAERLKEIAWLRRGHDWIPLGGSERSRLESALDVFADAAVKARLDARKQQKPGPNVAEFLDLVRAWERTDFDFGKDCLQTVLKSVFDK